MSQYILLLLVVLLFPLYRLFKRESTNTQYLLSKEQNQIPASFRASGNFRFIF